MEKKFNLLKKYIPEKSYPIFISWVTQNPFHLKITKERTSKFGDFRPKTKHLPYRISVNHNLNQYAFLITLTHEFAHLLTWENHRSKTNPHGIEWKNNFKNLIQHLILEDIFPEDIKETLANHIKNPAASSVRDIKLVKVLNRYNHKTDIIHLSEIEKGAIFSLHKKRFFIKGIKKRTRYLCKDYFSKKDYLINGIAEVEIVDEMKLKSQC